MKIVFIAVKGIPKGGGIEKLTEEIGSRLANKGHDVTVYASRNYGTMDGQYAGMRIKTVPAINTKSLHKLSTCFNATCDVLKKREADIVHVHAIGPSLFSIFPRLVGIPTVVQTHGIEWKRDKWGFWGRSFLKMSDFTAIFFPNKTTAVSKVQTQYFKEKYNRTVLYIPTGVSNTQYRSPVNIKKMGLEKDQYILFAGRFVREKGIHLLVEAFRNLDTDKKLVIAGDAAHAENYKAELKMLSENDPRILYPGFVTGRILEELYSNACLFCLPSTLEGLPIALLEAMSYGNCCLASDIPENIEAMQTFGYTFRNRSVRDLNQKLKALITQPERIEREKKHVKEYVRKNYSWNTITNQIEELYLSIVRR